MYTMNGKGNPSVDKSSNLEIKPTFRITLVLCPLCITCRPDTIMIVGIFDNFTHISRIKVTIEENVWLTWLRKIKSISLRN